MTLRENVEKLAEMRAKLSAAQTRLTQLTEEFNNSNEALIAMISNLGGQVTTLENHTRKMAVEEFNRTQNKKPVAGVTIKIVEKFEYLNDPAIAWAIENNKPGALSIQKSQLNKVLRGITAGGEKLPEFVTYNKGPQAQIATDLQKELSKTE